MKKKRIMVVVTTLVVIVLSYLTGYATCTKRYNDYYNATESMLDNIDESYFMDVLMETNAYKDYLKAKEDL